MRNFCSHAIAPVIVLLLLSGCASPIGSFHQSGKPQRLTHPGTNIPMREVLIEQEPEIIKAPGRTEMADNSIWNQSDAIYFRDTRAYKVGDILTVRISMNDSAKLNNRSVKDANYQGSLGLDGSGKVMQTDLPTASVTGDVDTNSKLQRGDTVNRAERIQLQVAAAVIKAAPNGNLLIRGSQEVRVNHEVRVLTVVGIVRSKDILPDNSVPYEKIAEARISYGGGNTQPGYRTPTSRAFGWTKGSLGQAGSWGLSRLRRLSSAFKGKLK